MTFETDLWLSRLVDEYTCRIGYRPTLIKLPESVHGALCHEMSELFSRKVKGMVEWNGIAIEVTSRELALITHLSAEEADIAIEMKQHWSKE